jgi:hypothetical protein
MMRAITKTGILVLTLAVALAAGGASAFAKGDKSKRSGSAERAVRGTVTAADRDSITVETRKRGSQKFKITSGTVIERLGKHGQVKSPGEAKSGKAGKHGKAGKARRIKVGSRVTITAKDGVAEKVSVKRSRHKGKKQ